MVLKGVDADREKGSLAFIQLIRCVTVYKPMIARIHLRLEN